MYLETSLINGVDIVDIRRIERILLERKESFLNRIFTDKEVEYLEKKKYRANTIAGLFASKEAISKAIGTGIGKISWKDMEIYHTVDGRPLIRLSEEILKDYNILELTVSISHEKDYAIAFVIGRIKS